MVNAKKLAHQLKEESIQIPDTLGVQRAATLNGTGYVFYIISPLAQRFIHDCKNKNVLEIGSGFSNVTSQALKQKPTVYIANDLSLDHLKILVKRIINEEKDQADQLLEHLMLMPARAPYELPDVENEYDAILLDKVLHFMNPQEIDFFISWVKKALKNNGLLYILTISPYIQSFKKFVLPHYQKKKIAGELYPGYLENINAVLSESDKASNPKYKIPDAMTFFDRHDLARVFERSGFYIQESFCVKLPRNEHEQWDIVDDEHSDLVALIAQKIEN